MKTPIYFVENQMHEPGSGTVHGSDQFIAIKHGELSYAPTTVYTQSHADELNRISGVTQAQAEAAVICSMFNTWDTFEGLSAEMQQSMDNRVELEESP